MKHSFLIAIDSGVDYAAAVFARGAENPFESITAIEKNLHKKNVRGTVIFDLLLSNGPRGNRFVEGFFDGEHFALTRFTSVHSRKSAMNDFSARFLKKNVEKLDPAILSKAAQYALAEGLPIA